MKTWPGTVAAQRRDQGKFDAQWLHDQTSALMAGRESYYRLPRAAWALDIVSALRELPVPVDVVDDDGTIGAALRALLETDA
jgi:hypothetical protein